MTIAILVQLHWSSGYLIDYYVNTDTYKALCINKDKPEMKCDGQCLLSRKLKEYESSENQPALPLPHISFEFTFAVFFMTLQAISPEVAKGNTGYRNNYSYLAQTKVFKPPTPFHFHR